MNFDPRWIIGKTIARVEMHSFPSGRGREIAHDPRIYFTDGSVIQFVTEETEGSEYGVAIVYSAPPRRAR